MSICLPAIARTRGAATRSRISCTASPEGPARSSRPSAWASSRTSSWRCTARARSSSSCRSARRAPSATRSGPTASARARAWETFVARDVVRAVDARYRTVRGGAGRALVGLSEGGYAALNIGIHHPREFRVLESWSGYQRADNIAAIFGHRASLLRRNSPLLALRGAAPTLRHAKTYVWFYSGTDDHFRSQNAAFAAALAHLHVPHRFFLVRGGHNWALWRGNAARALLAVSRRLHGA